MKVLLVNTTTRGGAATACIRLHKGLLNQGFDSTLLSKEGETTHIPQSIQVDDNFISRIQNLYSKVLSRVFNQEVLQLYRTYLDITPMIAKKIDLVNLHWTNRLLDFPNFFENISTSTPIVLTLHDMQYLTGGYPYEKRKRYRVLDFLQKRIQQKTTRTIANHNLHIVCLNQWMKKKSLASPVLKNFPHYIIPNGIDTSIFAPKDKKELRKKHNIPSSAKVVLFVSENLKNMRKGFQYLLDLSAKKEFHDLYFLSIGHAKERSTDKIHYTGFLDSEQKMAEYYGLADIFVSGAIEDNLPNTIVESLCCGTPVIGFSVGGIPEMIVNEENGFLASSISTEALAQCLSKALNKNWDRDAISHDAKEKYRKEVQAEAYGNLFSKLHKKYNSN